MCSKAFHRHVVKSRILMMKIWRRDQKKSRMLRWPEPQWSRLGKVAANKCLNKPSIVALARCLITNRTDFDSFVFQKIFSWTECLNDLIRWTARWNSFLVWMKPSWSTSIVKWNPISMSPRMNWFCLFVCLFHWFSSLNWKSDTRELLRRIVSLSAPFWLNNLIHVAVYRWSGLCEWSQRKSVKNRVWNIEQSKAKLKQRAAYFWPWTGWRDQRERNGIWNNENRV